MADVPHNTSSRAQAHQFGEHTPCFGLDRDLVTDIRWLDRGLRDMGVETFVWIQDWIAFCVAGGVPAEVADHVLHRARPEMAPPLSFALVEAYVPEDFAHVVRAKTV